MLDCGFSCKETVKRLERLDIKPEDISAIVVTHEHNDHISGVGVFSRKFNVPVWMNYGTYQQKKQGNIKELTIFNSFQSFRVGDITLKPFVVPHDSREAVQFVFEVMGKRLAVLTDLGYVTPYIMQQLEDIDALVIEANHDLNLLQQGSYALSLKQRVSGNYGHLNNEQAAHVVNQLNCSKYQHLIAAHLSQENNSIERTLATFKQLVSSLPEKFEIANQDGGFNWKVLV